MPTAVAATYTERGLAFWIHVSPGAKRERVGGTHGNALRVAVNAPPIDGRANAACLESLAAAFAVRRAAVALDPGARGRRKRALITGDSAALAARLAVLAAAS